MTFREPCPNCRYQRKQTDSAPDWQCPACGVAYAKAMGVNQSLRSGQGTKVKVKVKVRTKSSRRIWFDHFISLLLVICIISLFYAGWAKNQLPQASEISPDMINEPIQQASKSTLFDFNYRGKRYSVEPVADYELWGVVVSHNDITGITDITHNDDSVDIKDICVVWGDNVQSNDYRNVSYSSGDFTCYFQYDRPIDFRHEQLSNNHLLSADELVRERIRNIKIGDQVHLKGMLVNYWATTTPNWKRTTSTTRLDKGNRACEVVYVDEFTILKSSNRLAYSFFNLCLWLLALLIIFKLALIAFLPNFLLD